MTEEGQRRPDRRELEAVDRDAQGEKQEPQVMSPDLLEKAPPEVQEFATMMATWGPRPNPLFEKPTPEHLTKLIDVFEKDCERNSQHEHSARRYQFSYFIVGFLMFFAIMWFLLTKGQTAVFVGLCTAILGFAGGYGLGKRRRSEV